MTNSDQPQPTVLVVRGSSVCFRSFHQAERAVREEVPRLKTQKQKTEGLGGGVARLGVAELGGYGCLLHSLDGTKHHGGGCGTILIGGTPNHNG